MISDRAEIPHDVWQLIEAELYSAAASRSDRYAMSLDLSFHDWRQFLLAEANSRLGSEESERLREAFGRIDADRGRSDHLELHDKQRTWEERRHWRDD